MRSRANISSKALDQLQKALSKCHTSCIYNDISERAEYYLQVRKIFEHSPNEITDLETKFLSHLLSKYADIPMGADYHMQFTSAAVVQMRVDLKLRDYYFISLEQLT